MPAKDKGTEKKTFGAHNSNWKDPEKARAAGKKGNAQFIINEAKRAELKKITANKQAFLNNAINALHDEDPEFLNEILKSLADKAKGSTKDSIQAAGLLLDYAGIRAPKQTEVTVEDNSTIEDTKAELERLGVTITEGKTIQ